MKRGGPHPGPLQKERVRSNEGCCVYNSSIFTQNYIFTNLLKYKAMGGFSTFVPAVFSLQLQY